jgi:hypothetical protein
MSITKRLRIWWAEMTQDWIETVCPDCGLRHLTQGRFWADPYCDQCAAVRAIESGRPLW